MPNDYYSDAAPPEPESKPKGEMDEKGSDSAVATLPKSILAGKDFKVGDEIMLQITQLNEDSVVVKYAKGEEEGEKEAPPPEAPPAGTGAGSTMDGMMY